MKRLVIVCVNSFNLVISLAGARSASVSGFKRRLCLICDAINLCVQAAERTDYKNLPQPVRYEELQREVMSEYGPLHLSYSCHFPIDLKTALKG